MTEKNYFIPRQARLLNLKNPQTKAIIDQALVLYFAAPASETGEDLVELQCHGAPTVISSLLEILSREPGLRLAEPGEFTRRAFLNGKIDLTAVEGIADLVAADTESQRQLAVNQLSGKTAAKYHHWARSLTQALALSEAMIDFADEEIPQSTYETIDSIISQVKSEIIHELSDQNRGEVIRSGVQLAIMGATNVGKSSLLNYLCNREAAIVSPIAGTTRDTIEVTLDIAGFRLVVVDTAGIRQTNDPVELMGIDRSLQRAKNSQLILHVVDAQSLINGLDGDIPTYGALELLIVNKIDLCDKSEQKKLAEKIAALNAIAISLKNDQNLDGLWHWIEKTLQDHLGFAASEPPLITRQRHRLMIEQALARLQAIEPTMAQEIKAEELRHAVKGLGRVTGKVAVDDLLDIIFKEFCLGK